MGDGRFIREEDDSWRRIRRLERMTLDLIHQNEGHERTCAGRYVPPKELLEKLEESVPEMESEEFQRLNWDALRRSLTGLLNKLNASNVRQVSIELIAENLLRGRGMLVSMMLRSQIVAPNYSAVYAATVAVLNTKFPIIGDLLGRRLMVAFRSAFADQNQELCLAHGAFIAELVNQHVLQHACVLQMLMLLLERPSNDSVLIAMHLLQHCGLFLSRHAARPMAVVFERLRVILSESIDGAAASKPLLSKRVQFLVEDLFRMRKRGDFTDASTKAILDPELDLVELEDQQTHCILLDDEDIDIEEHLDVFSADPNFVQQEKEYDAIRRDILGDDWDGQESVEAVEAAADSSKVIEEQRPTESTDEKIKDYTDAELIAFRKSVYLTIMSSLDFEECGHKLLRSQIPPQFELELFHMITECCSNEKNYLKFYGLLAERFCRLQESWRAHMERCFIEVYSTLHRLNTNRIRNVSKMFAYLLETDAITWAVFEVVHLSEQETSPASRIFIKFLLQDLKQVLGLHTLKARFEEPTFSVYFEGMFPKVCDESSVSHVRFVVNYFTAVELSDLVVRQRLLLQEYEQSLKSLASPPYDSEAAFRSRRRPPMPDGQ